MGQRSAWFIIRGFFEAGSLLTNALSPLLKPRHPQLRHIAVIPLLISHHRLLSCLCLLASVPVLAKRPIPPTPSDAIRPKVVAYFGQWGVYDHFFVKNLVTGGAAQHLDQLNYAQGFVTGGHCSVADPNADLNMAFSAADSVTGVADNPAHPFRGNLHQLADLKRRYPKLRILLSLEGQARDFAADAQPAAREAFVRSCVNLFVRGHLAPGVEAPRLFDGIDVDWEYPHGDDAANFVALLTDLRREMNAVRPGLLLTIAAGPSPRMYSGVDLPAVDRLVDQVGLMNYDYNGPWNQHTGFLAPLYTEDGRGGSVDRSIHEWEAAGIPGGKLLLGIPFYGYGWQGVATAENGFWQAGHPIRGDRPYPFFRDLMTPETTHTNGISQTPPGSESAAAPAIPLHTAASPKAARPFILYRDPHSKAPWLFDGSTFWTYEDPTSTRTKARFARDEHLGGIMAWELSEDSADSALLHAAFLGLYGR